MNAPVAPPPPPIRRGRWQRRLSNIRLCIDIAVMAVLIPALITIMFLVGFFYGIWLGTRRVLRWIRGNRT